MSYYYSYSELQLPRVFQCNNSCQTKCSMYLENESVGWTSLQLKCYVVVCCLHNLLSLVFTSLTTTTTIFGTTKTINYTENDVRYRYLAATFQVTVWRREPGQVRLLICQTVLQMLVQLSILFSHCFITQNTNNDDKLMVHITRAKDLDVGLWRTAMNMYVQCVPSVLGHGHAFLIIPRSLVLAHMSYIHIYIHSL